MPSDLPGQMTFDFLCGQHGFIDVLEWVATILDELPEHATPEQLALAERLDLLAESLGDRAFRPPPPSLDTLRRLASRARRPRPAPAP